MASSMATATDRQGLTIVGEFLSVGPGRKWTGKDGIEREPFELKLLVRDTSVKVEYRDADSAQAALVEAGGGDLPARGTVIALPIFARAKGKDWLQYSGLNLRSED